MLRMMSNLLEKAGGNAVYPAISEAEVQRAPNRREGHFTAARATNLTPGAINGF
jgi:hypothetical protein